MAATFIEGRQWSLLTPLEWAVEGFEVKLVQGNSRRTDSEIEELIDKNWEERQAERKRNNVFVEDPWPKAGYRGHFIDIENRILNVEVSPANWKAMQGTNYNPEFFELMLKRFNARSRNELALPEAHHDFSFHEFIKPYLDGSMAQCAAIETMAGYPLGFRSQEVGIAPGVWHVPGGYLPGIGEGIYKSEVPVVDGKPVVARKVFTPDVYSMMDNARVNLFKESGSMPGAMGAEVVYTGLIYEFPNHAAHLTSVVKTGLDRFGTNWEHEKGKMRHFRLDQLPFLLNHPWALEGGIYKGGEAALTVAYLREKGLGSLSEFSFLRVRR